MIKAGIIGGAGYVAGELLRVLVHHPKVQIQFAQSNSQEGKPINAVHTDLIGNIDLDFTNDIKNHPEVDVIFLCGGHGKSRTFLENFAVPEDVKIIDMSRDFRLMADSDGFVYGLPEWQKDSIINTRLLANPGCFATAIQLGLLPLAAQEEIKEDVHVHAITGSTGAGAIPGPTTHFSWRNNNVSIYKAFVHQHMDEIWQSAKSYQPALDVDINFLPVRGNFTRGIYASIYMKTTLSEDRLREMYRSYYEDSSFVICTDASPNLKQVVNTNKAVMQVQKIDNKVLIVSMIDNLLKGAAGQAVQNMNLMFGLEETMGLNLKSVGY